MAQLSFWQYVLNQSNLKKIFEDVITPGRII
jgi:hypothetical protein